jgi:hypothetical protein
MESMGARPRKICHQEASRSLGTRLDRKGEEEEDGLDDITD